MKTLKLLCAASALVMIMLYGCTDDGDFVPEGNIKDFKDPAPGIRLTPDKGDPVYDRILFDSSNEIVTDFDGLALNVCVPDVTVYRGVTMRDIVLRCVAASNSHEEFIAYVTRFADSWEEAGLISERKKDAMLTCLSGIAFEF